MCDTESIDLFTKFTITGYPGVTWILLDTFAQCKSHKVSKGNFESYLRIPQRYPKVTLSEKYPKVTLKVLTGFPTKR